MSKPASFGDYLKQISTSFGALAGLGAALPLASLLPSDWAAFLFPPLGDLTPALKLGCVVTVLIVICCGYIGVGATALKKWVMVLPGTGLVVAVCGYAYF